MKRVGLTAAQVKQQCICPAWPDKPKDPVRVQVCVHRSGSTVQLIQPGKWHNRRTATSVARRLVRNAKVFDKYLLREVHTRNCKCGPSMGPLGSGELDAACVKLQKFLVL